MPTDAEYDELMQLIQAARMAQKKKNMIVDGKVTVRNPIDDTTSEQTVDAAVVTDIDTKVTAAEDALKAKFNELFP